MLSGIGISKKNRDFSASIIVKELKLFFKYLVASIGKNYRGYFWLFFLSFFPIFEINVANSRV